MCNMAFCRITSWATHTFIRKNWWRFNYQIVYTCFIRWRSWLCWFSNKSKLYIGHKSFKVSVWFSISLFKVYFKNVHPKFPNGGQMTQHLESLKIGDTIDVRGPSGRLQYIAPGTFSIKKLRKDPPTIVKAKKVNLIAGGVGKLCLLIVKYLMVF